MTPIRVLLAEDDPNLGMILKEFLQIRGFQVHWAQDGEAALSAFGKYSFDLCILDVMMPKMDGFAVAESIRSLAEEMPIIFLTAKSMETDLVKGYKSGADDYMSKPFSKEELILRINAVLKRYRHNSTEPEEITFNIGAYHFDHESRMLSANGETKKLTQKESEILKMLCLSQNRLLSREVTQKAVWGEHNYFVGRSMDVFISKLRKYLRADPRISIKNIHGSGFILQVEEA